MTEERHFVNGAASTYNQVRSNENQVKVNFTFEVPFTDKLREKIGAVNASPGKIQARLDKLVGERISSIAVKDNPKFQGRFVVTDIGDLIKGVYFSQSMIRLTTELELLDDLREALEKLAETADANADINLNCYF